MIRRPPRSTLDRSSAASDVYKRQEYTDYVTYEEYLLKIRKIIQQAHRVLAEGRFFVMNVSPVLIRRANRSEASRRIAVPFDMHRLFTEEGYEFIAVSYTHLRAHETVLDIVCRLLLETKNTHKNHYEPHL